MTKYELFNFGDQIDYFDGTTYTWYVYKTYKEFYDAVAEFVDKVGDKLISITGNVIDHTRYCGMIDPSTRTSQIVVWYKE